MLGIALQRRQNLLVAVGEPHSLYGQVFAMTTGQAIGHTQPQGQRAVIGNGRHTQLASRRFIPAPQHEELIAAGSLPVPEPFLMSGVTVGFEILLLAPQPLGPKAQPYPAVRYMGFQRREPGVQISQPAFLLVNLVPGTLFSRQATCFSARLMRALRSPARSFCCSLTEATFPSSDARTELNSRAGIPYCFR